ncbi:MAG: putative O-glycosylation ligase, exosortase A system-associated [Acetobacteraceae bacterium]|nr:putative O-glycosylation ligase, exosortase A system-associated [Acetobacteraceae bacterium]
MRNAAFFLAMAAMLPLAVWKPFVGILLWSWISFMNPHRELWGAVTNLPWAQMVVLCTVAGCVLAREPRRIPLDAVSLLLVLLAVLFTLTTAMGLGTPEDAWEKYDRAMKMIVVLLLTAALLSDRDRLHALVWLMVIAIGYYGVRAGLFTIATGGGWRVFGPPMTMIADNNHIGTAMITAIPLMNWLRMQSRHRIIRWGFVAAMVLTLFGVLGTHSRGALVALAAASCVLWWRSRYKLAGGAVMAAALAGAIAFMPQNWVDRMESIRTYEADASATTRLKLWEVSWLLAVDRPLLGAGFRGPYTREAVDRVMPEGPARAVHSIWFEVLGEHGFPTFVVWLSLTAAGFVYAQRMIALARGDPALAWAGDLGRMAQVSIVAYLAGGTFLSLAYWDFHWTLMVVLAAAHRLAREQVRAPARLPAWATQRREAVAA